MLPGVRKWCPNITGVRSILDVVGGERRERSLGARTSVDRSSLPVFAPLLVAFKCCSQYRQPHEVADGGLKLLLLLPVVFHHKSVSCLFPPFLLHAVMVAQSRRAGQARSDSLQGIGCRMAGGVGVAVSAPCAFRG
jgi:hypothetical protein